jgi:hypothetical protein
VSISVSVVTAEKYEYLGFFEELRNDAEHAACASSGWQGSPVLPLAMSRDMPH